LLGNHFGSLTEGILYNNKVKNITTDEVLITLESLFDQKMNELGYNLTQEQKETILESSKETINELIKKIPTYEDFTKDMDDQDKERNSFMFGGGLVTVLLFILILIAILIILCRFSIYRFAIWTGVTTTLVGSLFTVIGTALNSMLTQTLSDIFSTEVIQIIQNNMVKIITKTGFAVLIVGVVQMGYYFIVRKTKEYKKLY
jgi:hypothetical protein